MSGRECECRQRDCFRCELAGTREWLAAQGLFVVTAAEKAVLDAMADVRIDRVDSRYVVREADWDAPCEAELTRRGPVVP